MHAANWGERPGGDDLADAAVREPDRQQTGVLSRETGDQKPLGHRRDFDRAVVGEREQAVTRVPAGIEDFAPAHSREIGTPRPRALTGTEIVPLLTEQRAAVLEALD